MNSLPRWLISITDMPLPCQSSISSAQHRLGQGGRAGAEIEGAGHGHDYRAGRRHASDPENDDAPRRARRPAARSRDGGGGYFKSVVVVVEAVPASAAALAALA